MNDTAYAYPDKPDAGTSATNSAYTIRFIIFFLMPLLREAPDARA